MILASVSALAVLPPVVQAEPAPMLDYIGSVELRPDRGELSAGWTILILDPSLDEIRFALSSSFGTAAVTGSDIGQISSELSEDETRRLYQITLIPSESDAPRLIRFAYGGPLQLPPINTLDMKKVELTVDGGWYPYEPELLSQLTAQVGVQIMGDWTPLVIDKVESAANEDFAGSAYRVRQTEPSFDIAMSWLNSAHLTEVNNYKIYDMRTEPGTNLDMLTMALQECRGVYERMMGPLPTASILLTDRAYEAYSRGTLISLMDIENETEESLFKIVCHELSHHWSATSPGGPDDWINEGLAEYMALMAVRDRYGEAAYQSYLSEFEESLVGEELPSIWTAQITGRTPYMVSYRAAPLALAELEHEMGRDAFLAFLQTLLNEHVGETSDLLSRLEAMAGPEVREKFEARLAS